METGCLQVPDWTGQRCWPGSSSCCCCCWCFPRRSSWCCPPTSSFSGACWAAAALAPLAEQGDTVRPDEKEPVPPSPFSANPPSLQGPHPPWGRIATLLPSAASLSPKCRGQERAQGRFPSPLCFPQAAGVPRAGSTGCLQPRSAPEARQDTREVSHPPDSLPPASQDEARDKLWG